jgi:hypothetical protein
MARRQATPRGFRIATALVAGAIAMAFAVALPTSAHAWNGGFHGGGWHGGGWHGHSRSFSSFSLSLGFPIYPGPAYYPYAYPVYYAPPPVVVVPQGSPCQQGRWRQADGSVVSGVACLGGDGNWRLAN